MTPNGWKHTDDEWAQGELVIRPVRGVVLISAEGWHEDQEIPVEVVAEVLRSLGWTCAAPTGRREPDLSGVVRDLAAHILDRPKSWGYGGSAPPTFEEWSERLRKLAEEARELAGEE